MHRILAADRPVRERRNQRERPQRAKPEPVATAPNQAWSRGIAKLLGPTKWTHFRLCVVPDILSRCAVGWMVADRESPALAGRLIEGACRKQGVRPQALAPRSGRGAPMTGKRAAQPLADLGATRSLSRPQVSGGNPFSEARSKALKCRPRLPGAFPRRRRRHRLPPNALPLAQRRASPWRHRHARPGRCSSPSSPERAGPARTDPSSRPEPTSRTLRSRHPETRRPSRSGLDQSTRDTRNRRNRTVNGNRQCLKVVDRFRLPRKGKPETSIGAWRQTSRVRIGRPVKTATPLSIA